MSSIRYANVSSKCIFNRPKYFENAPRRTSEELQEQPFLVCDLAKMRSLTTVQFERRRVYKGRLALLIVFIIFCCTFVSKAESLTISESLHSALSKSKTLQIEHKRLETIKSERLLARSMWLPSIAAEVQQGRKKNQSKANIDQGNNREQMQEIRIDQSIFNGFRGFHKHKEVKAKIASVEADVQKQRQSVLFQSIEIYINMVKSKRLMRYRKQSFNNIEQRHKLIQQRYQMKLVDKIELMSAQTQVLIAQVELAKQKAELDKTAIQFEQIIGQAPESLQKYQVHQALNDYGESLIQLTQNNPEIQSKYWQWQSALFTLKGEKGKLLPTMNLSASLRKEEEVVYLDQHDLKTQSVYLSLRVPIFQKGMEYYQIKKARLQMDGEEMQYWLTREQIEKTFEQKWRNYQWTKNMTLQQNQLLQLSEGRLTKRRHQWQLGEVDRLAFLDAKRDWISAKLQQVSSHYDAVIAFFALYELQAKLSPSGVNLALKRLP